MSRPFSPSPSPATRAPLPTLPTLPTLRPRPAFARALRRFYRDGHRDLPWRRTRDPYRVWISEIMLQQTRVETVIPYYQRFLGRFPDVAALAAASLDEVLKAWEGLGYYARARHLHRAAREIHARHAGRFPARFDHVLALPGVGRSTAGSILCFARGERHPVLDGNIKRVLLRLYDVHQEAARPPVRRWLWRAAETLLAAAEAPDDHNQALLELGATVCVPRAPACADCPVRRWCAARRAGTQGQLPVRRPRPPRPHYAVAVGVVRRPGRPEVLIGQRPAEGLLGGLWEFPGGKQRPGEPLTRTVARELDEELGISVEVEPTPLAVVDHAYTHFSITLHAFGCWLRRGTPRPRAAQALRWVSPEDLDGFAFPRANHPVIKRLQRTPP
jgi:A/G-specific adenine glycosylase